MALLEVLVLLAIAGVCGAVGGAIAGTRRGCLLSIVVGFVGALLGKWLAGAMGLPDLLVVELSGTSFPILWSIIGSTLFVALIALMTRNKKK